jgi:hypothetical protein
LAVTVAFALMVTVHTAVAPVPHPDQLEKEFPPAVTGAVSVTDIPEL